MRIARALGEWLRSTRRRIRRGTVVGPLVDAVAVRAVLRRMRSDPRAMDVAGPDEFAPYVRTLTRIGDAAATAAVSYDYVILRQDQIAAIDPRLLATVRAAYDCVYANRRFALFALAAHASQRRATPETEAVLRRIDEIRGAGAHTPAARVIRPSATDVAMLVTTLDRPAALARTLPQLAALGRALVVIDDGSSAAAREANRRICTECDAALVSLPCNRGLAAALNAGLAYLLADRRVEWISYFQDDVDVDPAIFEALRRVADSSARPILTGYDADEHPAEREETIAGERVRLKRSSPAVHLHASVEYWTGVLPIPTEYLGAPRRRWEASLEDYWIVNHAPRSAGARGLLIPCLPGLVRTFLWHHADSTWGNPNLPDPPLRTV